MTVIIGTSFASLTRNNYMDVIIYVIVNTWSYKWFHFLSAYCDYVFEHTGQHNKKNCMLYLNAINISNSLIVNVTLFYQLDIAHL